MKSAKLKSKLVPGFQWRASDSPVELDAEIIKKMLKLSIWARGEILRQFAGKLPEGEERDELVQAIGHGDLPRARELAMHIAHTLPQKLGSAIGIERKKKKAAERQAGKSSDHERWQQFANDLRSRHPTTLSKTDIAGQVANTFHTSARTVRLYITIPAKSRTRP